MDAVRYSFLAKSFDSFGSQWRQYVIIFYETSGGKRKFVEVIAQRNNQRFIKKTSTDVLLKDLHEGATVTINTRQFTVTGCADRATEAALKQLRQRVLLMVFPKSMENLGKIVEMAERNSFVVAKLKTVRLDHRAAKSWVALTGSMDSLDAKMLTEGVTTVMDVRGVDAPNVWQDLIKRSAGAIGAVYASSSNSSAEKELDFFFGPSASAHQSVVRSSATCNQCSLCLIKPHAVAAGKAGTIIQALLNNKMEVSACKKVTLSKADSAEFLESYDFLERFRDHKVQLSSGPCIAVEVRGMDIVSRLRHLAGPYDVVVAKELEPRSFRASFGHNKILNAVHVTDLEGDGPLECSFVFRALA